MQQRGPWKVRGTKTVYKNRWMTVREDDVIRPDGTDGIYGVVTGRPGICVLPLTEDGYVYVQKEYHYAVENDNYELTAGAIEDGDSPLAAAQRELKEESGMTADTWIELGKINPLSSSFNVPQYLFIAKGLHLGKQDLEPTELIDIHKVLFDEAYHMVLDGRINYAPACILILRAKLLLTEGSST